MKTEKFLISLFLTLVIILTSCSVGPAYDSPSVDVPSDWKNNDRCTSCTSSLVADPDYWWQVFEDNKLDELEQMALENNRDLFIAYERIQEARALMGNAASEFYPQINLNPQYSSTGELIKTFKAPDSGSNANQGKNVFRVHELFYFLPITMSYEVDLWGKIRDKFEAAKYNWLAQKKDYQAVMLSLTTNLAIAYYQLRAIDARIDLLQNVIKTRQKALEINTARFDDKITFYADVTLAAEEVDSARIQYEEALRQRDVLEDQIAVLLGVPASGFCLEHMPLVGLPPCIPSGMPSEILLRRPDIAEAEDIIKSRHALVKNAYAQFFPSLTLTSAGGFESPVFKHFLEWFSRYWMVGGEANQLIFDGFKTPYYLKEQIARFKQATGEYQQQVLIAFKEVEDALTDISSYAKQYDIALTTTQWAEKTYQLYLDRYKLGVTYYINVANTERDLLNYQLTVNSLQGFRYVSTILLIKALGGGWNADDWCGCDE